MANATNATKIRRGGKGKPSKIKYVTMPIFSHHFCLPPVLSPWPLQKKRCKKSCSLVGCASWMISNREIAGTRQDERVPEHRSFNQSTLTKANPKLSSEGFYGCFYSELPALPTDTISFEVWESAAQFCSTCNHWAKGSLGTADLKSVAGTVALWLENS